ncbi:MAG: fumarate hydratase [Dehalococcoidales bacterium]|nr:fumarate hydratase [Dehalococcoidales bacterium]
MREIKTASITGAISEMLQQANLELGEDTLKALKNARTREESPLGQEALDIIIKNASIARNENIPLCQDCGTAIVFLEIGQDVHITGGDLDDAVNDGVRQGYKEGYLRKSIVAHPFSDRKNTGDNTPAVIHTKIVPGDKLKISVMSKGSGAENKSKIAMLKPGEGSEGIIKLVLKTIEEAGGSPCPPIIIGLGIGGTIEKATLMAKEALLRETCKPNPNSEIAKLEKDILTRVNELGIGPLGFGGNITALAVHAQAIPTHIASLPVAVNIQCHSIRHRETVL